MPVTEASSKYCATCDYLFVCSIDYYFNYWWNAWTYLLLTAIYTLPLLCLFTGNSMLT